MHTKDKMCVYMDSNWFRCFINAKQWEIYLFFSVCVCLYVHNVNDVDVDDDKYKLNQERVPLLMVVNGMNEWMNGLTSIT